MYSFRGNLYQLRFQGYDGFLGMIRFDNGWLWAALAALVLLRIPLRISLSHSLMADRTVTMKDGKIILEAVNEAPVSPEMIEW